MADKAKNKATKTRALVPRCASTELSLELPTEVQTDKVKAAFKNGILEIRLPKSEEAKKKETKVKVD
jgi:HSP20 family molecular chaperone IbpA